MLAFYFLSERLLSIFLLFSLLLIAVQTAYVALILIRDFAKRRWNILGECILLIYIAILATMPSSTMVNYKYGPVDVSNYNIILYIVAVPMLITFFTLYVKKEKQYLFIFFVSILTLPFMSNAPFGTYIICYALFIIILLLRSIHLVFFEIHNRNNEITASSIREGLDNLPSGIMFYDSHGYVYLTNKTMHRLMLSLLQQEYKNGLYFWKDLTEKNIEQCENYRVHDDIVFRCKEATWRFSKKIFTLGTKKYIELIASDITEIDKNFIKLEKNESLLLQQENEIQQLAIDKVKLKKEQEYARLRSQIHDVMGQRLTAIQRMLQSPQQATYNTIIPLLQDMVENIKDEYKPAIQESFFELKKYFERIGVTIIETGPFPAEDNTAYLFLSIIREAATNATKHANATTISVDIETKESLYTMNITNNGLPPKENITEGIGLSGIRDRVEIAGGKVYIKYKPSFSITVSIKKDNKNPPSLRQKQE